MPVDAMRRRVLAAGGALVLSFALRPRLAYGAGEDGPTPGTAAPGLPGSLKKTPLLDAWIRVDADNRITVFTGKAELGQGIKTALIQVAAEELVVAPAAIRLVTADTERTANEGYTAGSHSMQDSGTAIRNAAAQVRAILETLAAARFGVTPDRLLVDNGVIRIAGMDDRKGAGHDGTSVTYGALVAGAELHLQAQAQSVLRPPAMHRLIGRSVARIDIPGKVTGAAAYVQDLRLPGMVHGRIIRPPSPGAVLLSLDSSAGERLPGVLKVVRDGRFIGVIAAREYQAVVASRAIAAGARWSESATLPPQASLHAGLLAARSQDDIILERGDPAPAGMPMLSATYRRPYQLHASIGPSCAVAQVVDGKYTVWTHSQGVFPLRTALAELLHVAVENVHCIHAEGSGCYGHNGADDVAADAVLLARALPARPVRVQWMREDEHAWEPFGPPMVASARAALDRSGMIIAWEYQVWSATHNARPGEAGNLLAATHLASPFSAPAPKPIPQPEGGGDRNAIPLYVLPNARVAHHFLPDMPLRVSALRSLGAYCNVFAIESFMDELAESARLDPVAFRLRHLQDARAQDVIRLAAARFGWATRDRRKGTGFGFAFARYKNLGAYAAIALELAVSRETGAVRILRVVAAVDSGEAVNPDGIRNQVEGGIIQSASWSLSEEVQFDTIRILSRDWGGYPILRFPQIPQAIEVHVVARPGAPFLGTGEAAQGPTAAALANAIADATSVRVRDLPFSAERLRQLFQA